MPATQGWFSEVGALTRTRVTVEVQLSQWTHLVSNSQVLSFPKDRLDNSRPDYGRQSIRHVPHVRSLQTVHEKCILRKMHGFQKFYTKIISSFSSTFSMSCASTCVYVCIYMCVCVCLYIICCWLFTQLFTCRIYKLAWTHDDYSYKLHIRSKY